MASLSKKYERLKEIYGELEITPSLPLLEQNPSLPLGQKRKAIELEPVTYFVEYTGLEVQHFRDTLLQHLGNVKKSVAERTRHQRQYERRVNKRQMQTQESKIDTGKALDANLVDTESIRTDSTVQDDSSRSGNDTDADDANIRPIYDEEPMAEVQLTAECNIFAIGQQHTEQPEIIVEGRVDQYPETCQVKSPMLDSSPDNQTTEYSKQSLESENILLKETVAQFQKDFSRMEAHCIALELKYQNQSLKSGQHGQILNETSNKAKIEKEIDVLETMNIELEHSVATLRKENETLKQHYKDLYDSIKITRSKTTEQTTSLLASNTELKAQIQEKVFAIAALKNDLRKLKGNSVDTKFDKTSVLGKPVLPSLRNQSVVRQPNAFKSERAKFKQRFGLPVVVNKNLSNHHSTLFPKKQESAFAKPDHVIASSSSRNSSKNMPRFSSNDMVHNHYLDEARKKTQERDRNSKTSVMPSARFQSTADGSKPKPRSNNQTSRSLPCVFNANHDACITKLLKEVNSRAKIQSHKTRNSNKPVDQKSHTQKPGRQIFTGHRFSPNKLTFPCVMKNISIDLILVGNPREEVLKSVTYVDSYRKVIRLLHKQGTSINVQKEQSLDLSAGTLCNVNKENLRILLFEPGNPVKRSLNLPDHRAQVDQESQIKMIQVKEMMQDNDLKSSKSKDKGSRSRSQSMNEQSHYKQDKTKTRQSINVKSHIFNVIGGTEEFEERDLNIGGDC
ncbi:hypothetical protein Tco_0608889 [Tanacetum coccineum]